MRILYLLEYFWEIWMIIDAEFLCYGIKFLSLKSKGDRERKRAYVFDLSKPHSLPITFPLVIHYK